MYSWALVKAELTFKPGFHLDFFCLLLLVLVFRTNKNKKEHRRAAKGNKRQMETHTKNQSEQQKATKSKNIFCSHFHSFAPILDLWKVVDIKSNEKPERATTGSEKQ